MILLFCAALGLGCASGEAAARTDRHGSGRAERAPHAGSHRAAKHVEMRRPRHAARRFTRPAVEPDASGAQRGHASVYAHSLAGRRMADGSRFDPRADVVASLTLPLGSRAQVTNLRNGRSAIVQVRDRGPHTRGRILDVSPGVATQLGMSGGTALVSVAPITATPISFISSAEAATPPKRGRRR
jgi:rare lipoprotein A